MVDVAEWWVWLLVVGVAVSGRCVAGVAVSGECGC